MCVSGQENSGSFYGWSLHSLKGVVSEAGAHMADRLGLEDKSNGVGMAVSPSLCLCEDVLFSVSVFIKMSFLSVSLSRCL